MTLRPIAGGNPPTGRLLTCVKCGVTWRVYELPREFLPAHEFDCLQCGTLDLVDLADELERVQERRYDPEVAELPF